MKQIFSLFFIMSSLFMNAQKTITKPYFSFKCNCEEIENQYNQKNKSYNYTFALDEKTFYMISVKSANNDMSYLDAIKNAGVNHYNDIVFKGVRAITTNRVQQDFKQKLYSKDLLFFKGNYFYAITMVAENASKLEKLFTNLKQTFNTK